MKKKMVDGISRKKDADRCKTREHRAFLKIMQARSHRIKILCIDFDIVKIKEDCNKIIIGDKH
jgi:hypothetical protein